MSEIPLFLSICMLLGLTACETRQIKYSGFDDLVLGSETIYLYENGEFEIELGLGFHDGTYILKNDTILLRYDKPTGLPQKFLLLEDKFEAVDSRQSISIKRRKKKN